jgi:TAP-like protein
VSNQVSFTMFGYNVFTDVEKLIVASDAVHMASYFKDARLIEQNGEGHCSTPAISNCTIQAVRDYFGSGLLPPRPDLTRGKWPICQVDEAPWKPYNVGAVHDSLSLNKDILITWREIGEMVSRSTGSWKT